MSKTHPVQHGTLSAYITGFVASLGLTIVAYSLVEEHVRTGHKVFAHELLIPIILSLAIVQLFIQLFFFLHLGKEGKPRWNVMAFLLMAGVVIIVVWGSIWIMYNLNYNMMPRSTKEINKYLNSQDSL